MTPALPSRRDLGLLGLGAGAAGLGLAGPALATTRPERGIQLGVEAPRNPTDEDLKYLRQAGFDCVYIAADKLMSVEELVALRKRFADGGVHLHNVRWFSGAPSGGGEHVTKILLKLPGYEESMEVCKEWLRNYGKAGFGYSIATLSITGVWSSHSLWNPSQPDAPRGMTRFSPTRDFDENDPNVRAGGRFPNPGPGLDRLLFGRRYEEPEILENYKWFLKHLVPAAEDAGVVINFHPDDPPVYKSLGGVARINGTFAQIKRNTDLAGSPNIGPVMCIGVWLEGGARMGMSPVEAVRHFVKTGKVREINFRNVSGALPKFEESFMDNGYGNLYPVMKALVEEGYQGIVHQDHVIGMVGAPRTYGAESLGYMKAMLQAARYEAKAPGRRRG